MNSKTEKALVSFGKYLMSKKRVDSILSTKTGIPATDKLTNKVYDADLANWKQKQKS